MSLLEGERVTWRHKNEETGEPTKVMEGRVAEVSRSGNPAQWSLLILRDDGTLETHAYEDVIVQTGRPSKIPWAEAEAIDQLEAIMAGHAATPEDAIRGAQPRDYVPSQWGSEIQGAGPVERAVWYITKQAEEAARRGGQVIQQRVTLEAYERSLTEGTERINQLEAAVAKLQKDKGKSKKGEAEIVTQTPADPAPSVSDVVAAIVAPASEDPKP